MLRPLSDFVIIERDAAPDKTRGGIVIPDVAKEEITRGVVMAVGNGKQQESVLADELDELLRGFQEMPNESLGVVLEKLADIRDRLRNLAPPYEKGDKVLFGKYSGNDAKIRDGDGVEHDCVLARADEIYGLIEE